jgi:hypothetical protein
MSGGNRLKSKRDSMSELISFFLGVVLVFMAFAAYKFAQSFFNKQ